MKFGVVIFPGSNCDKDVLHVCSNVLNSEVKELWHKRTDVADLNEKTDCIILPGGFSYGDYLRSGAIASHSPIMKSIKKFAQNGGLLIGICNGFQILCESGLLPGSLAKNESQNFICKNVFLKIENDATPLTNHTTNNQILKIPIAHSEGRYIADDNTLNDLKANNQILFSYCNENGAPENPNGSALNIAGISNLQKNVIGMMPHPERAAETDLGNTDGLLLFKSLLR